MEKRLFLALVIVSLLSISFVLAAGSSTSGITPTPTASTPSAIAPTLGTARTNSAIARSTCEDIKDKTDRIVCRFDNPKTAQKEALTHDEEACRGQPIAQKEACKMLYKKVKENKCFDKEDAVEQKRCLLSNSGKSLAAGGVFRNAPKEEQRNYVVLLLYKLQENIEKKQADGSITTDEAASLITKIVDIKQAIISGKNRSEVTPLLIAFKTEFRSVFRDKKMTKGASA